MHTRTQVALGRRWPLSTWGDWSLYAARKSSALLVYGWPLAMMTIIDDVLLRSRLAWLEPPPARCTSGPSGHDGYHWHLALNPEACRSPKSRSAELVGNKGPDIACKGRWECMFLSGNTPSYVRGDVFVLWFFGVWFC